jgi:hypothetical protein
MGVIISPLPGRNIVGPYGNTNPVREEAEKRISLEKGDDSPYELASGFLRRKMAMC